ncbi:DUF1150 family protein [Pararhodobacter oceanensis]|uniref:DUF1150 family protein n=1 Tax=Pararhodobacter oceanensis TaxID=2172121 RepID=UPI003A93FBE2
METPYSDLPLGKIAYIREIEAQDLPDDIRAQLPEESPVWGVHSPEGECLAIALDRRVAFMLARENDFAPVSAH